MAKRIYSAPHFTRAAPRYSSATPHVRERTVRFSATRPKYGTRHHMPKAGVLNLSTTVRRKRYPI